MPIYEYECKMCSSRFELRRPFGDGSGVDCPQCQGETRRIFSAVPVLFKGPGFYVTDSAARNRNGPDDGGDGAGSHDAARGAEPPKEAKEEVC